MNSGSVSCDVEGREVRKSEFQGIIERTTGYIVNVVRFVKWRKNSNLKINIIFLLACSGL